jgi:hypothetical protein
MDVPNTVELGVAEQYLISLQILPAERGVWQLVHMSGVVRCGYRSVTVDTDPLVLVVIGMRVPKHFVG